MSISKKSVQKFKKYMKERYSQDLTDLEAREQAENVLDFFELLMGIDKRNN